MQLSTEERDLLALHLVTGVGPRLVAALLDRFGSAKAALSASAAQLNEVPYVGPKVAEQLQRALQNPDVDEECRLIEEFGVRLCRLGTSAYPAALAKVHVPPFFLYVRGTLEPENDRSIALVGSRSCTSYGRRVAERLAHDLARAGWTIVSGLARGIDAEAHRGALTAKGRTVAVLAGGLSGIYPPEHKDLAEQVAGNGALLTEASMRMEPMAGMFPARNRIISGLCKAVIVIEANAKSGALITARHAAEQGREVFAIPGQVDSSASAGTLQLLREGAKLVRNADDVLEDLQALPSLVRDDGSIAPVPAAPTKPGDLSPIQERIWDHLEERHTVDELTRHCEVSAGDLAGELMTLELKRAIRRLPGNWYERR